MKTLTLPLISALIGSAALPANAYVRFELSSEKTYRQDKNGMKFSSGSFDADLADGIVVVAGGCAQTHYVPPAGTTGCALGTNGFLTAGFIADSSIKLTRPYFSVVSVVPAVVVQPREEDSVSLIAAPASEMPRPSGGFTDYSYSLYYNLHTDLVREYDITRYYRTKFYSSNQRDKFENEIVPGVYHYSFPRLNPRNQPGVPPAIIKAVVLPMAEGKGTMNHQSSGFAYTDVNKNQWRKGFVELSYYKPNKIFWQGLDPTNVITTNDRLYFSMLVMADPTNPKSYPDLVDQYSLQLHAVFPDFQSGGGGDDDVDIGDEPRIWLANPFVGRFTTPPIFAGGTRAIMELELERNLKTGGVTYDFSERRFQMPIIVVNRYSEFVEATFDGAGDSAILEDSDKDGYNNLTEWILDSSATERFDTPNQPFPMSHAQEDREVDVRKVSAEEKIVRKAYYGFTIDKKLETVPAVVYTLQRSKDGGLTWNTFKSDKDWSVKTVKLAPGEDSQKANSPKRIEIRVESKWNNKGELITEKNPNKVQDQPPGTEFDLYRVKITLKKKK